MPKRIPTPEPGDDEPKYFTVVQPYPLNANWELPNDYLTFARWIACCIGPDPFYALFHKPTARGQVLIEIRRDYEHEERLLGEHRWSEFLKKPSHEEQGRVTQIFYCTYSTGRQVQKDGWKRINVEDSWFKNWSPNNDIVRSPYPPTSWCPLPAEDRTNKPMCRPLPQSVKPPPSHPPKAVPAPVVPGSAAWGSSKTAASQSIPAALKGQRAAVTRGGAQTKNAPKPKIVSSAPWHTATAPTGSNTIPLAQSPAANAPAAPAYPPGLPPPSPLALPGEADFPTAPPGLTRAASSASSAGMRVPASAHPQVAALAEGFVGITLSPSMEANLYGGGADTSPDPNAYVTEWEKMPSTPSEADDDELYNYAYTTGKEELVPNLWGVDDGGVAEQKKKKEAEIVCPVHGILCKKGICREFSRLLREKERKEKAAASTNGNGGAKGKGKGNGGGGGGGKGGRKNNGDDNDLDSNERKKNKNPRNGSDSGSATGSEGHVANNSGWSTKRR